MGYHAKAEAKRKMTVPQGPGESTVEFYEKIKLNQSIINQIEGRDRPVSDIAEAFMTYCHADNKRWAHEIRADRWSLEKLDEYIDTCLLPLNGAADNNDNCQIDASTGSSRPACTLIPGARLSAPPEQPRLAASMAGDEGSLALAGPSSVPTPDPKPNYHQSIAMARNTAVEQPVRAAYVVKNWIAADG